MADPTLRAPEAVVNDSPEARLARLEEELQETVRLLLDHAERCHPDQPALVDRLRSLAS